MAIKFEKIKEGMTLYDVRKNTGMSRGKLLMNELTENTQTVDRLVSCPDCPDQGWYVVEDTTAGCCGGPTEKGECCGNPVPVPTQEQEQCAFCWTTPNSVFAATQLAPSFAAREPQANESGNSLLLGVFT